MTLLHKKAPCSNSFPGEFYKRFEKQMVPILEIVLELKQLENLPDVSHEIKYNIVTST